MTNRDTKEAIWWLDALEGSKNARKNARQYLTKYLYAKDKAESDRDEREYVFEDKAGENLLVFLGTEICWRPMDRGHVGCFKVYGEHQAENFATWMASNGCHLNVSTAATHDVS